MYRRGRSGRGPVAPGGDVPAGARRCRARRSPPSGRARAEGRAGRVAAQRAALRAPQCRVAASGVGWPGT
ncbi:hypothetical protein ISF6_0700 [Piscinibacter sakaiensis]|uniref:Uncharacterized protein n=1 Tax=Piscinibacter sakaiensis TaxID=1547922 RepID=A0A0K8NXU7_PISS1|nr:hypothetical protein ISF6_0700 [Piscinibacter sakaiensis]